MPKNSVLVEEEDENYVMFSKLLAEAYAEGRVDGEHRCQVCGMRFNSAAESANCCTSITTAPLGPRLKERPSERLPRFQPLRWKRRRGAP